MPQAILSLNRVPFRILYTLFYLRDYGFCIQGKSNNYRSSGFPHQMLLYHGMNILPVIFPEPRGGIF